jgi:competence protein ComGC
MNRKSTEGGFTILSVLLALLVIGLLYVWLTGGGMPATMNSVPQARVVQKASVDLSCRMNLQALDKEILTWSATHPGKKPTIEELKKSGVVLLGCPEGGRWTIRDGHARCSIHSTTP